MSIISKDGKHFLNGREYAWADFWPMIMEYFWTGRGTGYLTVTAPESLERYTAIHNSWLDLIIKHGIAGPVVLFIFLTSVWSILIKRTKSCDVRIVCAFMMSTVIFLTLYNGFGYSHFGMQLVSWIIIGCGVGLSKRNAY